MRTLMAVVALVVGLAVYASLPAAADEKTAVILVERVQDGPKGRSKSQLWR